MDPLPARRVRGPDAPARLRRAGRARNVRACNSRRAGEKLPGLEPGLDLAFERGDGPLERRERRFERDLGELRFKVGSIARFPAAGLVRIPVRPCNRQRAERAGPAFDLLEPKSLAKLGRGLGHANRPTSRSGLRVGSGLLPGGRGLTTCLFGTSLVGRRLLGLALGLRAEAALERAAHAVVHGPRLRRGSGSGCVFLGTGERRREQHAADEHGDQDDPGLRDDAARQRALRLLHPLLPAAHRSPSAGVNRQPTRLSPTWSHPSPSTWRAM